ncbi:MAG: MarR family winged helix-turn-helix transcriptional regulator [Defluviitaleaceae bacterium]|nr:MarR family winged helix-turn-helix transcriptional regulator [Defluviitaleaceae bacterium]
MDADIALGAVGAGASRLTGLYTKFAQKHGMTYGTIQVYYALKLNRPVTQKQICELYEIPKQTVNGVIRQLRCDGYITLSASGEDRREKEITLTQSGEAHVDSTLNPFFELNEMVLKRVGTDALKRLSQGLAMLGDALELEMELKEINSKWNYGGNE